MYYPEGSSHSLPEPAVLLKSPDEGRLSMGTRPAVIVTLGAAWESSVALRVSSTLMQKLQRTH